MHHTFLGWAFFLAIITTLLVLDLGFFHKNPHRVSLKESLYWSLAWVVLSLLFAVGIFIDGGAERGALFLTGYLVEKSLSIDNVFLFTMIFSTLHIPQKYQHRVLFWGVLSALIMRAVMLYAGLSLIERFEWLLLVFGGILIATGIKLLVMNDEKPLLDRAWIRKMMRWVPIDKDYRGKAFWIRDAKGRFRWTPLFLALVLVEIADLIFALDSIPAVLAITQDPFLVYTSNVFALLGLRSLYFVLAHFVKQFDYLKKGIAFILCFIGVKMLVAEWVKISSLLSLFVIITTLAGSIFFSLRQQKQRASQEE